MQVSVFVVPVFLLLKDNGFFVHVRKTYGKAHTRIRKQLGFTAVRSAERLRWPADEARLALCRAGSVLSTTDDNASPEDEYFEIGPAPASLSLDGPRSVDVESGITSPYQLFSKMIQKGRKAIAQTSLTKTDNVMETQVFLKSDLMCMNGCEGADAEVTQWCQTCDKHLCSFCVDAHKERTQSHLITEIFVKGGMKKREGGPDKYTMIKRSAECGEALADSKESHSTMSEVFRRISVRSYTTRLGPPSIARGRACPH